MKKNSGRTDVHAACFSSLSLAKEVGQREEQCPT